MSKKNKKNVENAEPAEAVKDAKKSADKSGKQSPDTEKKGKVSKAERERVYKKPPLAKIYDKLLPGDYTMSQDRNHALCIFIIIAVILGLVTTITWFNLEKEKYSVSDTLLIPEASYVMSQEQTVANMLDGYGFKNITMTEDGISAHGTPEMVKAYEDSYYDKNIAPLAEMLANSDFAELGVDFVDVSDDCKTMIIATAFDYTNAPDELKQIIVGTDIDKLIQGYAVWCRMINEGEPMTIKFLSAFDISEGYDETEYYTSTRTNGDSIIADMEAALQERAKAEAQGDEQNAKNENDAENESQTDSSAE